MPREKIGEDVLGYEPPRMPEKKRRELEQRMKEELAKMEEERRRILEELGIAEDEKQKIRQLEEEGKLPKLPIPSDLHEKKLGEAGYDKIIEEQRRRKAAEKGKTVHVSEHYRHPPGKAEETEEEAQAQSEEEAEEED